MIIDFCFNSIPPVEVLDIFEGQMTPSSNSKKLKILNILFRHNYIIIQLIQNIIPRKKYVH